MKGVNNKLATGAGKAIKIGNAAKIGNANTKDGPKEATEKRNKGKRASKSITASELTAINRRLDQCLPMETMEWQRVEQLLMQVLEFAPSSLVYETGMAVALYADDQARRAYCLGRDDAQAQVAGKHSAEDAA